MRKKNGDVRICVDYRALNKQTIKDAYPLPRPDEVQDRLAGCTIFSTLDLRSGYWQLPVHKEDQAKTAFCPGPGLGLFQFRRMPFGLSGAPASFQRLMDQICRDLPFATTYLDDLLIHSRTLEEHKDHLHILFERLSQAGLTLRGDKCTIGLTKVKYLGHLFSAKGMEPDHQKIAAVCDWDIPKNVSELKSFLGLASYYRRYICQFADIAAPLNNLTNKAVSFVWDNNCQSAFECLKSHLTRVPVLAYPDFSTTASHFQLHTDASATGLGAVLEQGGKVVAYASRTLNQAERNYSVIQRECLAIIYALKQFRHYLLGRPFTLLTDHAPLQWLAGQKMEGLLARWALATQEYDFTISYRKGSANGNADALSRKPTYTKEQCATTLCLPKLLPDLHQHQADDPVISQLSDELQSGTSPRGRKWHHQPLRRYKQIWSQLLLKDGIVCRQYTPGPHSDKLIVPIIPKADQQKVLYQCHDVPKAGHVGSDKTAMKVRQLGYWVGMLHDINQYCSECVTCQSSKSPAPQKVPLISMPIGKPWEMVAVDILQVPTSCQNHRYILVIQDYFTKWAEAIPLPNQTAATITRELVKVFSNYGLPEILHSDQGRNFESTLLQQTLDAFGITKSRTTAYHPQGDGMVERFNRSLLQMLRAYVSHEADWEKFLPLVMFAYRTSVHTSTGAPPFELMFGRNAQTPPLPAGYAHDTSSYPEQLRCKLSKLYDFVETHMIDAAHHQQRSYNQHVQQRSFQVGDTVWLDLPTAGKLDPKWEGGWIVKAIQGPTTYVISDGNKDRTVHINRLHKRIQPAPTLSESSDDTPHETVWNPPMIEHEVVVSDEEQRYPQHNRRAPDYFHF